PDDARSIRRLRQGRDCQVGAGRQGLGRQGRLKGRTMYRLHGFCQSGNTFKVAFCLLALGQKFETVFVDFLSGATRDAAWRERTNEMGEAPVLEDGAKRMTQSGMILRYLSKKHGKLGGRTQEENEEILRWILFDNHKFTSYFATYRFLVALGPAKPD